MCSNLPIFFAIFLKNYQAATTTCETLKKKKKYKYETGVIISRSIMYNHKIILCSNMRTNLKFPAVIQFFKNVNLIGYN